jgi:hypothetical protein
MEWIVVDRSNDQLLHIHVRFCSIFMSHTHAKCHEVETYERDLQVAPNE